MYLIDSNIFIEAKNRYYAFDLVPSFWSFLDSVFSSCDVRSVQPVYTELASGNDDLAQWVKQRKGHDIFLDVSDNETQVTYSLIANSLSSSTHYKPAGVAHFLSGADPWIAAKACSANATLVTHEGLNPDCRKKVPLGNVCTDIGVNFIDTFEFLRRHGFKL